MTGQTERLNTALAGRYRILRHLGEGGMASVYLCDDIKHERKVALKLLKPELAAVLGAETADWMRLTPQQRWVETIRLSAWFHALGGTSDPDPDPSSPCYDPAVRRTRPVDGGPSLRVVRRSRV